MISAPLSIADVLDAAADLIEPEGSWTQGSYAKDAAGRQVLSTDESAVCWCAVGAITRVSGGGLPAASARRHLAAFCNLRQTEDITDWNDWSGREHSGVVGTFRKAAALAREQQA